MPGEQPLVDRLAAPAVIGANDDEIVRTAWTVEIIKGFGILPPGSFRRLAGVDFGDRGKGTDVEMKPGAAAIHENRQVAAKATADLGWCELCGTVGVALNLSGGCRDGGVHVLLGDEC